MGYATVSHVEAFCPARAPFGALTSPNASQVALYIEEATLEVEDSLNRSGYAVPVPATATYAFRFMQGAVAKVAAYLVEQNSPTTDTNRLVSVQKMRDSALAMIRDGEIIGYPKDTAESFPRSGFDASATPAFQADQMF